MFEIIVFFGGAAFVGVAAGCWSLVHARHIRQIEPDYRALQQCSTDLPASIKPCDFMPKSESITLVGHYEGQSIVELPQVGGSVVRYIKYYRN